MAPDLADMEWSLEITVIAAKDLKDAEIFGKMNVYVDAHISGGKSTKTQSTPVHKHGGTNPSWCHALVLTFDGAAARAGCLTLHFRIKAQCICRCDKDVGRVDVPVRELLEQGGAGDGQPKVLSYGVRLPSGKTKGVLEFSYKFDERFTIAAPPPEADEPAMGHPAAAALPASNSVVAYPPPMQGAVPNPPMPPGPHPLGGYSPGAYAPPGAYPPPGHVYPLAGPGYAAPPQADQTSCWGRCMPAFAGRLAADELVDVFGSVNDA